MFKTCYVFLFFPSSSSLLFYVLCVFVLGVLYCLCGLMLCVVVAFVCCVLPFVCVCVLGCMVIWVVVVVCFVCLFCLRVFAVSSSFVCGLFVRL